MPKTVYTEEDKARAYVVWKGCNENITATARETGIPAQTIRDWREKWQREGPPNPELVTASATDELEKLERIADKSLSLLDSRMHLVKNPKDLATIYGILNDKIRLTKGLVTSRNENVASLPSPRELGELMAGMVKGMLNAKEERDADIIDVLPVEEQGELPLRAGE